MDNQEKIKSLLESGLKVYEICYKLNVRPNVVKKIEAIFIESQISKIVYYLGEGKSVDFIKGNLNVDCDFVDTVSVEKKKEINNLKALIKQGEEDAEDYDEFNEEYLLGRKILKYVLLGYKVDKVMKLLGCEKKQVENVLDEKLNEFWDQIHLRIEISRLLKAGMSCKYIYDKTVCTEGDILRVVKRLISLGNIEFQYIVENWSEVSFLET